MTIKLGVCGLGRAFSLMLPTFSRDRRFELVAAATPGQIGRDAFARDFGGRTYHDMASLCGDAEVEAIYIASPHELHCEHVELAAAAGKHCLLEKPVAITLEQADRIAEAVAQSGIKLVVGPCHSFDAPVARTKALIDDGRLGRLKQIQAINYTEFLYRPRRPEELDTDRGGGVIFSQAIHQIDIVRLLAGGRASKVFAMTGNWDPERPTEGAYSAILSFEDDLFAALTYNGYGRYDSDDLMHGYSELGFCKQSADYGSARRLLASEQGTAEADLKRQRNLGYADTEALGNRSPDTHEHFGFIVASCEYGDIRLYPDGLEIFDDTGRQFIDIAPPEIPRQEVLDELHDVIVDGGPNPHSAAWGRASLEVAIAMLESAASCGPITLCRQVPFDS